MDSNRSLARPRSLHSKPTSNPTPIPQVPGNAVNKASVKPVGNPSSAAAPITVNRINAMGQMTKTDQIRVAKQKGYEGDPCPNCQSMTLVRSGACAKCDTCGETSGCG